MPQTDLTYQNPVWPGYFADPFVLKAFQALGVTKADRIADDFRLSKTDARAALKRLAQPPPAEGGGGCMLAGRRCQNNTASLRRMAQTPQVVHYATKPDLVRWLSD